VSTFTDWDGPGDRPNPSWIAKKLKELADEIAQLVTQLSNTDTTLDTHISNITDAHNIDARLAGLSAALRFYAENVAITAKAEAITAAAAATAAGVNDAKNTAKSYTDLEVTKLTAPDGAIDLAVRAEAELRVEADTILSELINALNQLIDTTTAVFKINEITPLSGDTVDIAANLKTLAFHCDELYLKYVADFVQFRYVAARAYNGANGNYVLILGKLSERFEPQIYPATTAVRPKPARAFIKWVNSEPWNAIVDMSATITNEGSDKYTGAISALCSKTSARTTPISFGLYYSSTTQGDHHIYLGIQVDETTSMILQGGAITGFNFYVAGINFIPLQSEFPAGSVTEITRCSIYSDGEFGVNAISVDEWLRTDTIIDKEGNTVIKETGDTVIVGQEGSDKDVIIYSANRPTVIHEDLSRHKIAYLTDIAQSIYWQKAVKIVMPNEAMLDALLVYYILIDPDLPDTIDNRRIVSPDIVGALYAPGFYETQPYSPKPYAKFFAENDVALLQSFIREGTLPIAKQQAVDGFINTTLTDIPTWYSTDLLTELDKAYIVAAEDSPDPAVKVNATTVHDVTGAIGKFVDYNEGARLVEARLTDISRVFAYTLPAYITFKNGAWDKSTLEEITIPETFDGAVHDISYEWSGAHIAETQDNTGDVKYYIESYVTWTVHHENNLGMKYDGDAWASIDLPLDGYRSAARQDEIDDVILGTATTQADYAEPEDTIQEFKLPDGIVHKIANPAYIQNKPWTGVAIADAGEFAGSPFNYAKWLVDGGDFTGIAGTVPGFLPAPIPSSEQFKNVIMKVWRGKYSEMPEVVKPTVSGIWQNFAFTLRWCLDTNELWFSDGSILHLLTQSFKVEYSSGSWEWIRTQIDGGGHFYWDAATGYMRYAGPNEDTSTGITWMHYVVNKGGPGFSEQGGTNNGVRLITAWDSGVAGQGTLRIYYLRDRAIWHYAAEDEILTQADLLAHTTDYANPHQVTKDQVGLDQVDNTSDMDKPVSTLQAAAIANAVLSTQIWLSSVLQVADLPDPSTLDPNSTYLCRVLADPVAANNGVWQLVALSNTWTFYSGNADFITQYELDNAMAAVDDKIDQHINDISNPHKVTAAQVGLGQVDNTADENKPVSIPQQTLFNLLNTTIYSHVTDKANPHAVTKAQVGLGYVDNTADMDKPVSILQAAAIAASKLSAQKWLPAVQTYADLPTVPDISLNYLCSVIDDVGHPANNGVWQWIADNGIWTYYSSVKDFVDPIMLETAINGVTAIITGHTDDRANPHQVTAAQVGLGSVTNTSDMDKPVSTTQATAIATAVGTVAAELDTHITDENNPHNVTKEQIGLGNVSNTADNDKPVSAATKTALDKKVAVDTFADTNHAVVADLALAPVTTPAALFDIIKTLKNVGGTQQNFVINVHVTTPDSTLAAELSEVDDHNYNLSLDVKDGGVTTAKLADEAVTAAKLALAGADAVTKSTLGLSAVDNTADEDKPVSKATAEAIANAQLSTQTWLPAVETYLLLPVVPNPDQVYLCRVLHDPDTTKNGVYQWIPAAGTTAGQWDLFGDNVDFIDETELEAALTDALQTTLSDEAASSTLPATTKSYWYTLLQTVRNNLKHLFANKQDKLNRAVIGNDNASASVTDTGGALSVSLPLTTVAPSASSTQTSAGTGTLRAKFKVLVDNIAWLFTNKQDNLVSGTNIKTINNTTLLGNGNIAVPTLTNTMQGAYGRNVDYVDIPSWRYGDGSMHIIIVHTGQTEYGSYQQCGIYCVRMWSGGSQTSWSIWVKLVAGDAVVSSWANAGATILRITFASAPRDYSIAWI
jgi:hypothetical protein